MKRVMEEATRYILCGIGGKTNLKPIKSRIGAEKFALNVIRENEGALALYEKLGFEVEGVLKRGFKNVPSGVYHDEIVMAKFV